MSRKDNINILINRYQRHLQKLQEQRAELGINTPAGTLTQIEDIEAEIERRQTELQALEDSGTAENVSNLDIAADPLLLSRGNEALSKNDQKSGDFNVVFNGDNSGQFAAGEHIVQTEINIGQLLKGIFSRRSHTR